MAAPLATNVNVKQEEPDPDTGLCLICTLPIRIPGGEPDASSAASVELFIIAGAPRPSGPASACSAAP